jgi:hypothetical protein
MRPAGLNAGEVLAPQSIKSRRVYPPATGRGNPDDRPCAALAHVDWLVHCLLAVPLVSGCRAVPQVTARVAAHSRIPGCP